MLAEEPVVIAGQAFTSGRIQRKSFERILPNSWVEFGMQDGAGCDAGKYLPAAMVRQDHAADAYRMYFRKVPTGDGDYVIDHAAVTYVMDADGKYVGFFPPGTQASRMLEILRPRLQPAAR